MHPSPRTSRNIILTGILGIICILIAAVIGGWQYIRYVPPFQPRLPPMPSPNGYLEAERAVAPLQKALAPTIAPVPPGGVSPPAATMPTPPTGYPPVPPHWPNGTPKELRAYLIHLRPALHAVRASFRHEWRARLDLSQTTARPPFTGFRECARGFAAESLVSHDEGDDRAAMRSALDAIELGSRVPRGGDILHLLVALAIHAIGYSRVEPLATTLPANVIPEALLRVRRLRNGWPHLSETLEHERTSSLAQDTERLQEIQGQSLWEQWKSLGPDGPWGPDQDGGTVRTLRLMLTPRRLALANMDLYYRRLIAEGRKPVRRRIAVPEPGDPWSELLADVDPLANPWLFDKARTHLALLEVALAVRMHYLEHGRYPARLPEISKKWLPVIPVDLWDQPIAYRLKSGQPVIYSLGPDGKDDGGQPTDPIVLTPTSRGDLVFGRLSRRLRSSQTGAAPAPVR